LVVVGVIIIQLVITHRALLADLVVVAVDEIIHKTVVELALRVKVMLGEPG
jgi:hypothetical protein